VKAIILVGGEGTRLRPLTLSRLKSTVSMAGRPFLEYQFALLKRHGVRDVTLSICHMPELIRKTFGDGRRFGLKLHYAIETKPLGTGGAIKNAQATAGGREAVVVMNGDILTDINLKAMAELHRKQKALVTIGLTWVEDPSAYGLVHTAGNGRVNRFVEKPDAEMGDNHWINTGIYLFSPEVFDYIPESVNYSAERGLFPNLLAAGKRVWAYPSRCYWMDIGTPAKYLRGNLDLFEGRMPMLTVGSSLRRNARLRVGKQCKLHPEAKLVPPAVLGDRCQVGPEAAIGKFALLGNRVEVGARVCLENCVIGDQVVIGEGARLTGCVVGAGCRIGRFATVGRGVVLGDGAQVPDYSRL